MRTKTLLLAGALSLAGLATSLAQSNVYSLNVVGYINLNLTPGFNLVGNQLDLDGTGTNNTVLTSIGTNLPNLSRVYTFDPSTGTFPFLTFNATSGSWLGSAANLAAVNKALNPGGGVWVSIPGTTPQTVTLVGNVRQGALVNMGVNTAGYAMLSSQVPQAGLLKTDLLYTAAGSDRVYQYLSASQSYGPPHTYNAAGAGSWIGGEPTLAVGEAIWVSGHAGSAWTRNFTVQ